jgi:hypothetical protein
MAGLDKEKIRRRFGSPLSVEVCHDSEIWRYGTGEDLLSRLANTSDLSREHFAKLGYPPATSHAPQ